MTISVVTHLSHSKILGVCVHVHTCAHAYACIQVFVHFMGAQLQVCGVMSWCVHASRGLRAISNAVPHKLGAFILRQGLSLKPVLAN